MHSVVTRLHPGSSLSLFQGFEFTFWKKRKEIWFKKKLKVCVKHTLSGTSETEVLPFEPRGNPRQAFHMLQIKSKPLFSYCWETKYVFIVTEVMLFYLVTPEIMLRSSFSLDFWSHTHGSNVNSLSPTFWKTTLKLKLLTDRPKTICSPDLQPWGTYILHVHVYNVKEHYLVRVFLVNFLTSLSAIRKSLSSFNNEYQ